MQVMNWKYEISEQEYERIIKIYFKDGSDGPMSDFPVKESRKAVVLHHLVKRFNAGKEYTEKEVTEILKSAYSDPVLLRRYLVDFGFMNRLRDGSCYWVNV
jgi:hypothetical protein